MLGLGGILLDQAMIRTPVAIRESGELEYHQLDHDLALISYP